MRRTRTEEAEDSEHVRPLLEDLPMNCVQHKAVCLGIRSQHSAPMPASAIVSKSSPSSSIRLTSCALALSSAATASNSFFFSRSLAAAAAFATDPGN